MTRMDSTGSGSASHASARRWAIAAAAIAAALLASLLLIFLGAGSGLFDREIADFLSARAGRRIAFSHLQVHLLGARPLIVVDGLVVGSPAGITRDDVLEAPRLSAHVRLGPLLIGRFEAWDVTLDKPVLRLVRLGHGRNNYSLGSSGSTGGLAGVDRLVVADGQVHFLDVEHQSTFRGRFAHDPACNPRRPLVLTGGGVLRGEPYLVDAHGAPLNARVAGAPYPFDAVLNDGRTRVSLAGSSGKPFDFQQLDLRLQASGPNLSDFRYLFNALAPNSPPFSLSARLRRDAPALSLSEIVAKVGRSDVTGRIDSDHRPGTRRVVAASLHAKALYLHDVQVMLAPHPSHAVAREQPGAGQAGSSSNPRRSERPFNVEAMRKADLRIAIRADRAPDALVAVRNLSALLKLTGGRLSLDPLRFSTDPGRVQARLGLDASRKVPLLWAGGAVRGARLAALRPSLAATVDGDLDATFDLHGEGASLRAAARDLAGRASLHLSRGRLQRTKALVLGGKFAQALFSTLGGKGQQAGLTCAAADFAVKAGRFRADRLAIVTDAGAARGDGFIDLGQDSIGFVLRSAPARKGLFQIDMPIGVQGSLAHPVVRLGADKALLDRVGSPAMASAACP